MYFFDIFLERRVDIWLQKSTVQSS